MTLTANVGLQLQGPPSDPSQYVDSIDDELFEQENAIQQMLLGGLHAHHGHMRPFLLKLGASGPRM